jgi:hypothetical protein
MTCSSLLKVTVTTGKHTVALEKDVVECLLMSLLFIYLLQDEMMNPVTFMASSNQDTMYFHQPSNEST